MNNWYTYLVIISSACVCVYAFSWHVTVNRPLPSTFQQHYIASHTYARVHTCQIVIDWFSNHSFSAIHANKPTWRQLNQVESIFFSILLPLPFSRAESMVALFPHNPRKIVLFVCLHFLSLRVFPLIQNFPWKRVQLFRKIKIESKMFLFFETKSNFSSFTPFTLLQNGWSGIIGWKARKESNRSTSTKMHNFHAFEATNFGRNSAVRSRTSILLHKLCALLIPDIRQHWILNGIEKRPNENILPKHFSVKLLKLNAFFVFKRYCCT